MKRTEDIRDHIARLIVDVDELKFANKLSNPLLLFCFIVAALDVGKNWLHWF